MKKYQAWRLARQIRGISTMVDTQTLAEIVHNKYLGGD
jgi:hypothetical protein